MKTLVKLAGLALALTAAVPSQADPVPRTAGNGRALPLVARPFTGTMGRTLDQSTAAYAVPVAPPAGAPNVVIVMLDDVGFGHPSTFGGPVPTPTLDKIAKQGLRFNNFHTTGMCSPTRAALLTGRNHHRTGSASVPESGKGFPGYDASRWGQDAASLAQILGMHGYSTSMFGKWHNTPEWEAGPAGPFDRWPTGKGFDYFYGSLGGDTNQWAPALYENITPVTFAAREGYTLNEALSDQAIGWLRNQKATAPAKPFFLYFAPVGTHAPLQAPKQWIDRFKGRFDEGWDLQREKTFAEQKRRGVIPADARLTPRPPEIPAWDSFTPLEQRAMARLQEVYAGYLAQTDHEVGRVLDAVQQLGQAENTLVIYIAGDNGPSAEGTPIGTVNEMITISGIKPSMQDMIARMDELGGPTTAPHYASGWAWAGSTPFQFFKRVSSHLGSVRNGMALSWPKRIGSGAAGGLRTQFQHVTDILPTVLDAAQLAPPTVVNGVQQLSYDGASMLGTIERAGAPSRHRTQYFEIHGTYAIYHDGWMASARHTDQMPWVMKPAKARPLSEDTWQLYDLRRDFSQSTDLAAQQPGRLQAMKRLFDREAWRNHVYPMAGGTYHGAVRPNLLAGQERLVLYPGMVRLREGIVPTPLLRSHSITAEIGPADKPRDGIVITQGGRFGGYSVYFDQGHLVYSYNYYGLDVTRVRSSQPVPPGEGAVRVEFERRPGPPGTGGAIRLYAGDTLIGQGDLPRVTVWRLSLDETLDVGEDHGTAVDDNYQVPHRFTGELRRVVLDMRLAPVAPSSAKHNLTY